MNKGIIITIIVIIVVIFGGMYIANQQSKSAEETKIAQEKTKMMEGNSEKETMEQKEAMMEKDKDTMQKTDDKMMGSRYIEYSKAALDKAASTRRVLFFYANWCPICKPADADFTTNASKIPSDVTLIRVNYNDTDTDQEEKDLAKQYGITYQHTFVQIDAQGKEITKWNGGKTSELLANIK